MNLSGKNLNGVNLERTLFRGVTQCFRHLCSAVAVTGQDTRGREWRKRRNKITAKKKRNDRNDRKEEMTEMREMTGKKK